MTLLELVAARLDAAGIRYALIGASALAAHGVSRSTLDQDLLVGSTAVLDQAMWRGLPIGVAVDIRAADAIDPLGGVVRLARPGDRDVDLLVSRGPWMEAVLQRAPSIPVGDRDLRIVDAADLVLLKLYAGGLQDRWDIEQILALDHDGATRGHVEARLDGLPSRCRTLWEQVSRPQT